MKIRNRQNSNSGRRGTGHQYDTGFYQAERQEPRRNNDLHYFERHSGTEYENSFFTDRDDDYRNHEYYGNREDAPNRGYGRSGNSRSRYEENYNFGNENSQYGREENRSVGNRNPNLQAAPDDRGYRGRNTADYQQDYRDGYHYNPSDFDRRGFRKNPGSDDYNHYADDYRRNEGRDDNYRRSEPRHPHYSYYESYPSYGQGAPYNDHEYGYIDKQESRGRRGVDNEDTYDHVHDRRQDDFRANDFSEYGSRENNQPFTNYNEYPREQRSGSRGGRSGRGWRD